MKITVRAHSDPEMVDLYLPNGHEWYRQDSDSGDSGQFETWVWYRVDEPVIREVVLTRRRWWGGSDIDWEVELRDRPPGSYENATRSWIMGEENPCTPEQFAEAKAEFMVWLRGVFGQEVGSDQ